MIEPVDAWLAQVFAPAHREHTTTKLADHYGPESPDPARSRARASIAECDAKIARYRAVPDAGGDPALVTTSITQTQADRLRAQAELDHAATAPTYAAGSAAIRSPISFMASAT